VFFTCSSILSSNLASPDSTFFSSALLFSCLSSLAEIPTLYAHRPLILRHQKAAMYHPFIEAAAMTLVDIPITLVTLTAYSTVLYSLAGLQGTAGQFL
jgi:ATP-binding cassette subfamily G (WHITE) protein 2 (SNQ2)